MKFISVNENIDLRKDAILGVERTDGENCQVLTTIGVYSCTWPYSTLKKFLETDDSNEKVPVKGNLWGAQHWAG